MTIPSLDEVGSSVLITLPNVGNSVTLQDQVSRADTTNPLYTEKTTIDSYRKSEVPQDTPSTLEKTPFNFKKKLTLKKTVSKLSSPKLSPFYKKMNFFKQESDLLDNSGVHKRVKHLSLPVKIYSIFITLEIATIERKSGSQCKDQKYLYKMFKSP